MTRARTVQVSLAMLAAVLLALQVFAHGARATQEPAAEPAAAQAQAHTAVSSGHAPPQPEEMSGHFWNRCRPHVQGACGATAEPATQSPSVPASPALDACGAGRYSERGVPGAKTLAVLQVLRC
ncbi:hypothetical protein [Streptomyces sioyaensis]|uniref:hypothetical protein n=1 Tax=Streptomyces sioyaensis TaxID=67364 RepID=UPI0036E66DDC